MLSYGVKIVSIITERQVIRQILKHPGLWTPAPSRNPPGTESSHNNELIYGFFDERPLTNILFVKGLPAFNAQADGCSDYDESCIVQN